MIRALVAAAGLSSGVLAVSVALLVVFSSTAARAWDYAPMCDAAGSTVAVPGPAPDAQSGEIDTWLCGDKISEHLNDGASSISTGKSTSNSQPLLPLAPDLAVPNLWALPARPFINQLPVLSIDAAPTGAPDADGLYRPPRIHP